MASGTAGRCRYNSTSNFTANRKPVGARLARDKSTAILKRTASSLIAGKPRSHSEWHSNSNYQLTKAQDSFPAV